MAALHGAKDYLWFMAAMCAAENKGGGFDHKVIDARGYNYLDTGCSLNIMFFSKILEYSGLLPFSVFPLCQCVYHSPDR